VAKQIVLPAVETVEPGHEIQEELTSERYVPAGHGATVQEVLPEGEVDPAGQGLHDVSLLKKLLYVPAAQASHWPVGRIK